MYLHPLLNALLNEKASNPSKQLIHVRCRLKESTVDCPTILLILPPAQKINKEIDIQCLFHDFFLLSHVVDVSELDSNINEGFAVLNGLQAKVLLTKTQVIPDKEFTPNSSSKADITDTYIWRPGLDSLPYNAAFIIVEVNNLVVNNEAPKRFSWFGSRSTPQPQPISNFNQLKEDHVDQPPLSNLVESTSQPLDVTEMFKPHTRNPAFALGRTKAQREQNMAKVDYCLACLQQDVVTSSELAERFHKAVTAVRASLIEAGGLYTDSTEEDSAGSEDLNKVTVKFSSSTSFTLANIYEYAEARLGKYLLSQLSQLMENERHNQPSFVELYKTLKFLDIAQVDIPNLDISNTLPFEYAINDAALILGRLCNAQNSTEMCNVFLAALKRLADPTLGTVSADTLLGLFMLTVLRVSEDTAAILELYLHFVTNFSYQASDTAAMKASAGRVSYTLMVVQSVLLQLRMESARLAKLANSNKSFWSAIRGDDRETIKAISEDVKSSLSSRRSGKSALFMAAEDHNVGLLKFLLENFSDVYTKNFIMNDRDMKGRTLFMVSFDNEYTYQVLQEYFGSFSTETDFELAKFYSVIDLDGRNLAFYLHPSKEAKKIGGKLDWTVKDVNGNTPILYHAKTTPTALGFFIQFCTNLLDHTDNDGNNLLHLAVKIGNPELVDICISMKSCDMESANKRGETALELATTEQVRKILLDNGANPWTVRLHDSVSPSLRTSRIKSDFLPYVTKAADGNVLIYQPPNAIAARTKSIDDFVLLNSVLQTAAPTSWVPPLRYLYPERFRDHENSLFSRFYADYEEAEMQRLTFWLRQLVGHATIRDSSELAVFLEEGAALDKRPASPYIGNEDEDSMCAFLKLGAERLLDVQNGLEEMSRHISRLQSLAQQEEAMALCTYEKIHKLTVNFGFSTQKAKQCRPNTLSMRMDTLFFDELAAYASSFRDRLQTPLQLAEDTAAMRTQLSETRNRLRLLAEGRPKVSWIASIEEKRNTEIQNTEAEIVAYRQSIPAMEAELRSSYYYLANELSSFNELQEDEVLRQVEMYSLNQLRQAKSRFKNLQFGSQVRPTPLNNQHSTE